MADGYQHAGKWRRKPWYCFRCDRIIDTISNARSTHVYGHPHAVYFCSVRCMEVQREEDYKLQAADVKREVDGE